MEIVACVMVGVGLDFVYVVVQRVVFDLGVPFTAFEDSPLLMFLVGFSDFVLDAQSLQLGAPRLSFVCCYFTTPVLASLVLVKTHCDFNKFHFSLLKKNVMFLLFLGNK